MSPARRLPRLATGLITAAIVVATTAQTGLGQTTLRYRFTEGDVTKYVMVQSMTMQMRSAQLPQPVETRMKQTMFMELTTNEVRPDGSALLKQRIARWKLTMKIAGPMPQTIEYDSASGEEPEGPIAAVMLKAIKPLVGAEWSNTMTARGEIQDVIVPDKLKESLKAIPNAAMMGDMATPEGLKNLTSQAALIFPEGPIKPDDSWDAALEAKMPFGKMITRRITTYRGPTDQGMERMELGTEVTFEPAANAPATLKIKDNKSSGEILFDPKAGRVQRSELRQVTEMEVTAAGQMLDQTVTTEVTLELDDGRKTEQN